MSDSSTHWALQLSYDGGSYAGFMALPDQRTVQAELEAALQRLLRQPIRTVAAGRTDAGVHAYGQIISFSAKLPFGPERLLELLNRQVPADLSLKQIGSVPEHFHARFSARARHYRYLLNINQPTDPFKARYSWQYPHAINPERLKQAWSQSLGTYDFSAFERSGGSRRNPVISVWQTEVRELDGYYALDIVADSFLYSMVRNLVGTALDMARGRLAENHIQQRLAGEAGLEGITAPAQGLYLCQAIYAPEFGITANYPHPLSALNIPAEALIDPGKWWK